MSAHLGRGLVDCPVCNQLIGFAINAVPDDTAIMLTATLDDHRCTDGRTGTNTVLPLQVRLA